MEREQARTRWGGYVRRTRAAALLVAAGLAVEAASLPWPHPLAFLSTTLFGTGLVVAGACLYLWAEVSR